MSALSVLADGVAQMAKVLEDRSVSESAVVDSEDLLKFHQGLMTVRMSLESMQKKTAQGNRDRSPERRGDDYRICSCAIVTAFKHTCRSCRKKVCRACAYFYEDEDLDILSCKNCLNIAVKEGHSPPEGCGKFYFEAAVKKFRTYRVPDKRK